MWTQTDYSNAVTTITLAGTIEPINLFNNISKNIFYDWEAAMALVFKPLKNIE